MKNRKKFLVLACVVALAGFTLAATSCKGCKEDETPDSSTTDAICVAPEITVTDEGFYWASVTGASSYQYKFNDGTWANANGSVPFPTTAGAYVLYMKATDAQGRDGRISETPFSVEVLTSSCEQVGNSFVMGGTQIHYSVNGGEEAALGESKTLDFSASQVGTVYSVEYYAKGEFWSEETKTYYLSSERKTVGLTITQALATPVLRVENESLVWAAVENASAYAVTVNGESATQTQLQVALPKSAGAHTITVQALSDNATYTSSTRSELSFTVKTDEVPTITYNQAAGLVAWDSNYGARMCVATDGVNFLPAQTATTSVSDGLRLKLESYFDAEENIYYLDSKTVYFANRSLSSLAFNTDGYVSWNTGDEALEKTYYVSVVNESQEPAYNLANNNVKNISTLTEGAYVLQVYAADYIQETETELCYYLPSETKSLVFKVLDKPTLSYEGNRLVWSVDDYAAEYQYKKSSETTWTVATTNGYVEVSSMDTYEVRAIGSGAEGSYSLTSSVSSLLFDPTLTGSVWSDTLASFNQAGYLQRVSNATGGQATTTGTREIITEANASDAEKAILAGTKDGGMLKVTAGNASPKFATHFGNGDGMNFQLFTSALRENAKSIIFRIYLPSSETRKNAWVYNAQGEFVNGKGRSLDKNGNVYAFFDGDTLVGYLGTSSKLLAADGTEIAANSTLGGKTVQEVSYDGKSTMTVTFDDATKLVMARRAYGILDDADELLGVADETGAVKNGDTLVGTLNEKGELVNDQTVLSTSAVKQTQNLDGYFCFGVEGTTGSGTEYRDIWRDGKTSPIATNQWVEVEIPLSSYTAMTGIVRVTARFLYNGVEGESFYIDEIRYGEMNPNEMPTGMIHTSDTETIINPIGWRTEVTNGNLITVTDNGIQYANPNKTSTDRTAPFIFYFDEGVTLETGDKVVVTFDRVEDGVDTTDPENPIQLYTDMTGYQGYFNGDNATTPTGTYFLYSAGKQNPDGFTYTVPSGTSITLNSINILLWGTDNNGGRDITVTGVYIIKASQSAS